MRADLYSAHQKPQEKSTCDNHSIDKNMRVATFFSGQLKAYLVDNRCKEHITLITIRNEFVWGTTKRSVHFSNSRENLGLFIFTPDMADEII